MIVIKKMLPIYLAVFIGCLCVAHLGNQAVTVVAESAPYATKTCVVIDAGHGGIDGGATSCSGVLESQFNLEIAARLNDLLRFLGYETIMLRTNDTSLHTEGNTIAAQKVSDLKHRVKVVNSTDNAILVSIHQNTFPNSKYSGAQVFYAPNSDSASLATAMQSALIKTLNPNSNRKSKPSDGIYLMQNIQTTGILIECGFLSNVQEESKLRSVEYQQKLSCVIATTLSDFIANT